MWSRSPARTDISRTHPAAIYLKAAFPCEWGPGNGRHSQSHATARRAAIEAEAANWKSVAVPVGTVSLDG